MPQSTYSQTEGERSDNMAIQSAFTTTSYTPTKTLQPVVQSPVSTQTPQPKTEPNLSQTAQTIQPVQTSKTDTKEQQKEVEKSTKRFALRLTSKQRAQVKRLKKAWGLSTESSVIKKLIDDSKEENKSSDLTLQVNELTAIKMELNRIGININQIAKKANQLDMTMDDLNAVMRYMNEVCEVIYGKELTG